MLVLQSWLVSAQRAGALLFFLSLFASVALFGEEKQTILILSSTGGGGHVAAANTLQSLVGEKYRLVVVNPIDELRILGVSSGEQFYNTMLKKGWIRAMNFIVRHLVPSLFRHRQDKLEKVIHEHITYYQPDLIISLIPFVNYPASEAARKQSIPYLLITTDNDLRNWVLGMENVTHPDFRVTIGSDLPTTKEVLLKKHVAENAIATIGLPLRPEFVQEKDLKGIREEFQVPEGKKVVLIMMGGSGGNLCYSYADRIGRMDLRVHLIVITGKNTKLKRDLARLRLKEGNSITILGQTEQVSDLMAISDLIVTKPGPGTINEAIAMKLPMLIDNTNISLFWERANVDLVLHYGVGQKIRKFNQLQELLEMYLGNGDVQEGIRQAFIAAPPNRFNEKIVGIIDQMIHPHKQALLPDNRLESTPL
jgi:UDP-N-acetylglucosamine:LPS N-acetylglucosamine transferase